jgi:hypothetical protein
MMMVWHHRSVLELQDLTPMLYEVWDQELVAWSWGMMPTCQPSKVSLEKNKTAGNTQGETLIVVCKLTIAKRFCNCTSSVLVSSVTGV